MHKQHGRLVFAVAAGVIWDIAVNSLRLDGAPRVAVTSAVAQQAPPITAMAEVSSPALVTRGRLSGCLSLVSCRQARGRAV